MFWTGTSPKSVGIQASLNSSVAATNQDTAKKDRAAEFFLTASNENIGVADEIGLIAWKTLKSSQLFVVSALFKVPFQLPYFFKSKKVILCLAITSTGLKSSKSFTDCQERNFLLDDIRKRNSLKLPMIIATTAIICFLRCLSFLDRSIEKLIYYIYRRNKTTTLRIVINQRNGLNNLLDAHQIVDDYNSWYRDKLDRD
jgi:hypothetical protein